MRSAREVACAGPTADQAAQEETVATTRAGATKRKPADGPAGNGDAKLDERALEDLFFSLTA